MRHEAPKANLRLGEKQSASTELYEGFTPIRHKIIHGCVIKLAIRWWLTEPLKKLEGTSLPRVSFLCTFSTMLATMFALDKSSPRPQSFSSWWAYSRYPRFSSKSPYVKYSRVKRAVSVSVQYTQYRTCPAVRKCHSCQ